MEQNYINNKVTQNENEESLEGIEKSEELEEVETIGTESKVEEKSVTEDEYEDNSYEENHAEESEEDDDDDTEQESSKKTFKTTVNLGDVEITTNYLKATNPAKLLGKLHDIRENNKLSREEKNQKTQQVIKEYSR